MKKLTLIILVLFSGFISLASNQTVTNLDPIKDVFARPNFNQEFNSLDLIESTVLNGQVDLETLKSVDPTLIENLDNTSTTTISSVGDLPLGIPAIVWGICCSVAGLAIVYFATDNDKEQVKKAAIGCLVGTLVWGGACLLFGGFGSGGYYYY
ncbi:MAG: hypothetical protein ACRCVT_00250 [Leadbetterella sp.]